jgi:adenylate kinase
MLELTRWIIFIGCPGSGKGVQAECLKKKYGYDAISMGDLLRNNKDIVINGKTLGNIITEGKLVPASVTIDLVEKRLKEIDDVNNKNVLFEGWPREIEQVKGFSVLLKSFGKKVSAVLNLIVPEDTAKERILGRYLCKKCGKIYNKFSSSPIETGVCDVCGGKEFETRSDDANIESLKNRIITYNKDTMHVIEYYRREGILHNIKADLSTAEVEKQIVEVLNL